MNVLSKMASMTPEICLVIPENRGAYYERMHSVTDDKGDYFHEVIGCTDLIFFTLYSNADYRIVMYVNPAPQTPSTLKMRLKIRGTVCIAKQTHCDKDGEVSYLDLSTHHFDFLNYMLYDFGFNIMDLK